MSYLAELVIKFPIDLHSHLKNFYVDQFLQKIVILTLSKKVKNFENLKFLESARK